MTDANYQRFLNLDFRGFAELAKDATLSKYEKIGFPDSYRAGHEAAIFADIAAKLPSLARPNRLVLDIGPGCSDLPAMMIELCQRQGHELVLVDSQEMLALLPERPFIRKIAGLYPRCGAQLADYAGRVDAILCYSVLQYVFVDANVFDLVDLSLSLLAPGGEMLIGDIPNISKRKRFLASEEGVAFHRRYAGDQSRPEVAFNRVEPTHIDDSVVLALLARARAAGAHAYVVEQAAGLPMANRREDIVIRKP